MPETCTYFHPWGALPSDLPRTWLPGMTAGEAENHPPVSADTILMIMLPLSPSHTL